MHYLNGVQLTVMIQYLRSTSYKPRIGVKKDLQPGSWIRVEDPNDTERTKLIADFKLDETILLDALDPHEVPRIEEEGGKIYFITRLPDTDDEFNDFTTPIMFVIHAKHIITVSRDPLARLWQPFIDKNTVATTQQTQMLLMMLESIVQLYERRVAIINRQMRAAIGDVTRLRPADIATFVEYERKLNDYLDALVPSNNAIEKLLGGRLIKLYEDDKDLVEDLSIDLEQIIVRCKSLLRTITNVRDSYRAVMDTRLNETIRLLTVITLAVTIPTMLAGLYGMNVQLPGQQDSYTFWIIASISFLTSGAMAFYFLRKRR